MTVELYFGDCLEYMKSMPDKSVDAVITDPPYGIGIAGWDKVNYYDILFETSKRILREGCYAFIFSTKKNLKRPKFNHDIYAVIKNFAQYRQHLGMIDAWYPIVYFTSGKPRKLNQKRNWFLLNTANTSRNKDNPKSNNNHITPKNQDLINHLVDCHTNKCDTIFDPFMGSGTTGIACVQLGRNFIGCEIDPDYFAIAKKRIEQAQLQDPLFV